MRCKGWQVNWAGMARNMQKNAAIGISGAVEAVTT
jgi:hypothetical protein